MRFSEQFKTWILILAGSLSVGLAFAGIFLPLLPTTPFLLLAAACYIRSSDRFYHWLIYHRWFGNYIRNYREGRGIPLITKITAITLLWLTIGYSALFVVSVLLVKFVLIGIALGVTIHLLKTKTLETVSPVSMMPLRMLNNFPAPTTREICQIAADGSRRQSVNRLLTVGKSEFYPHNTSEPAESSQNRPSRTAIV